MWHQERERCVKAFDKWVHDADQFMSPAFDTCPATFFPLLPVVKVKDKWVFERGGKDYKVRLCLDFKNGGLNDSIED